jgi:two-component system, OmpR family, alkaline phosphatase synthesis response regulator PhoP
MDILVVDDDAAIRGALVELLQLEGHRVYQAGDGAQAVAVARAVHPDAVLLDLMMPVMDGRRCLAALRADPAFARTVFVVLSASEPGVPDALFLAKPFTFDQLLSALDRAAGREQGDQAF